MIRVRLTEEQSTLLESMGTVVLAEDGGTYRNLHDWFKETEEEGVFELPSFDDLPDRVKEYIWEAHEIQKLRSDKHPSLHKNNESWEDVVSGFSLENNLVREKEQILDELIEYLDKNYPDTF